MADSIVAGLFGPQPWQIEQAQQQAFDQTADRYATMNPFQQASGMLFRGGGGLARGGANMAGMQTPQMVQAQRTQAILSKIDTTTAEGLAKGAMMANQAGDPKLAFMLAKAAQDKKASEAEVGFKQARTLAELKKAQTEGSPVAKVNPKDFSPQSIAKFRASGDYADLEAVNTEGKVSQKYLQLKEAYGDDAATINAKMREWIEADIKGAATKGKVEVTNVMPGTEKPIDVSKFRNEVRQSIGKEIDTLKFADTALASLDLAIKKDNPTAFQSARVQLARAAGDSNISMREIEAAGGDPSLFGALFDKGSIWVTGTPTLETQKKMKATIKAIRKVAAKKARNEIDSQAVLLYGAGYDDSQVNALLRFADLDSVEKTERDEPTVGKGQVRTLKSGKKVERID